MTDRTETAATPWTLLAARTLVNIKGANGEQIAQLPKSRMADAVLIVNAVNAYKAVQP